MKSKIIDFSNLKGDFIGGLVAGVVALPLLAFGVQSGMGATAGLYGQSW
jgi:SulP family sulfate permease